MKLLNWLKKNFIESLPLATAVLLLLFFIRSIEIFLLNQSQYIEKLSSLFLNGMFNDLLFSILILLFLTLFPWYKRKIVLKPLVFIIGLLLTIGLISSFFFTISLQLLDRTIYQFSYDQIINILQTFGSFKWYYVFIIFPIPLLFFLNSFMRKRSFRFIFFILGSLISLSFILLAPKPEWDFEKLAAKNKVEHFVSDSYAYFSANKSQRTNGRFTTSTNKYPLLKEYSEENPLGSLFEFGEKPPNLVFIITESLSSAFSGPYADEISFTPFLDSLAQHSIYLNNFIATSERTFGVLPSTLASLPHGERGFTYMRSNMPNHHSIISILTNNGYKASFYYGGDSNFDFMKTFMENNGVTTIIDHGKKFDIKKKTKEDEGKPFGVNDSIFFEEVADSWQNKLQPPFIHTYLSLSMHYPFEIENQSHYINLARKIIDQKARKKELKKEKYYKQLKVFSTAVYTDQAIRRLIHRYQKEESYENTIFLIYGDHSFGPTPKRNTLEKYRTPLYIYSPLLKKAKHSKNVNSHLDLPPTLLNLLKDTFNLDYPKKTHWIGRPFEFSESNKRSRELILMLNSRVVEDFLSNNYFLAKQRLFAIDEDMNIELIDDQKIYDSLSRRRDSLLFVQNSALNTNSLIVDDGPEELLAVKMLNGKKFTQNNEYVMLLEHELERKQKAIQTDLKLNLKQNMQNKAEEAPLLIMAFKDKNDSLLYWKDIDYKLPIDSSQCSINYKMYFKNNSSLPLNEGLTLKIYFWNQQPSNANFELVNSTIHLKAKQ